MKAKTPHSNTSDVSEEPQPVTAPGATLRLRPVDGRMVDRSRSLKPGVRRKNQRVPHSEPQSGRTSLSASDLKQRSAEPKNVGARRVRAENRADGTDFRRSTKGVRREDEASVQPDKTPRKIRSQAVDTTYPLNASVPDVMQAEGVRLSKIMADRGICSRREADTLIERGWVFVDGRRVSQLGIRVQPDVRIVLAPEAKNHQATQVTILLHKPVGYVSGQPEPGFRPAVELIGSDNQFDVQTAQRFHFSHLKGIAPAGRLDIDSTGLLVLTQDGRIARQLIGQDASVEKEYLVRVEGTLIDDGLALLQHGLMLDGRKLRPAQVEWINQDQLRFLLREGRKRQIRRMCELVGLKVIGLKRVRIGQVRLGDLPLGQWRYLRSDERF